MASRRKRISVQQLAGDMRGQMQALSPQKRRAWVRKVVKQTMINGVLLRYLTGKGPGGQKWQSPAAETKMGGRWSAAYKKRPSGDMVTADKTRNVDTAELANSYDSLTLTEDNCVVGPKKNPSRNRVIAEKEAEAGNVAVGFDDELKRAMDLEMLAYAWQIAQGKEPPALPKSTIGRRSVRVG